MSFFSEIPFFITLPEAVRKGLHSPFGQAVPSSSEGQSAQDAGHIYHPALGFLQEWQKLKRHVDYSYQIYIQNLCKILCLHPIRRADGNGPAGVVHQSPQTCRVKRQEDYHSSLIAGISSLSASRFLLFVNQS